MARGHALVTALMLVTLSWQTSFGGPPLFCEPGALQAPSADPAAYAVRDRGRYCDGTVRRQHAGGDLEVVAVSTAPATERSQGPPAKLSLLAVPASCPVTWPIHLQGLAMSVNYRLDAALQKSAPSLILGSESALRINPTLGGERVGWAAWSETADRGRLYIPVILTDPPGGDVEVTIRPAMHTAYVKYSVRSTDEVVLIDAAAPARGTKAMEPVTFRIPPGNPVCVTVRVAAYGNAGDVQTTGFDMLRPGLRN